MNQFSNEAIGIIRRTVLPEELKSNVTVCSNVYVRREDVSDPRRDVAFRCRIRGSIALREIVPPGIVDNVSGHHEIPTIQELERAAAFDGTLAADSFCLLPEQVAGRSPYRCIECGRSQVSVWYSHGKVEHKFVLRWCMCKRLAQKEGRQ